jgi:chromosome segregation ATPase
MERLTYRDCAGVACFRWENPRGTAVIANEAISRLAAYEDIGLMPERIRELQNAFNILFESERQKQQENEQLKEQINTAKIGWDTYKTYSEQLEQQTAESNKIIETQRQEIEKLKATLADWKYEVKCHMDEVIAREKQIEQLRVQVARMRELLTKAYDEIEKYKCLWKGSKPSGCDCPKPTALQDEIEQTLAEIDKAIGGKEDV